MRDRSERATSRARRGPRHQTRRCRGRSTRAFGLTTSAGGPRPTPGPAKPFRQLTRCATSDPAERAAAHVLDNAVGRTSRLRHGRHRRYPPNDRRLLWRSISGGRSSSTRPSSATSTSGPSWWSTAVANFDSPAAGHATPAAKATARRAATAAARSRWHPRSSALGLATCSTCLTCS